VLRHEPDRFLSNAKGLRLQVLRPIFRAEMAWKESSARRQAGDVYKGQLRVIGGPDLNARLPMSSAPSSSRFGRIAN
jgi:hypothetical protein